MRPVVVRLTRALRQVNYWLIAQFARATLAILRRLPPDKALNFADRAGRRVGPWIGRHRVALDNLREAYPEKSEAEIAAIASDMWGNMSRLAAEYIFLDQLFDFVPNVHTDGRIEVVGVETFLRLAAEKDTPHIIFTGHLGNFELLPVAGAAFGLTVTSMFRPPNNPYIADYVFSKRTLLDGKPARFPFGRGLFAGPYPGGRRKCRRTGRPEVHAWGQDEILRTRMRDQPACPQACAAIWLRRLSGTLHPLAGQPLPAHPSGQA